MLYWEEHRVAGHIDALRDFSRLAWLSLGWVGVTLSHTDHIAHQPPPPSGFLCFHVLVPPPPPFTPLRQSINQSIQKFCKAACDGFDYYGTQFERECWCGSGTPAATYELYGQLADSACDDVCTGDSSEACGGAVIMSVYTSTP